MSDRPKIQGTLQFNDWNFTIRVDSVDELGEAFEALSTHAGQIATSSVEVKQAILGQSAMAQVPAKTEPQVARMQGSVPPPTGPPPVSAYPNGKVCHHGEMVYREGTSKTGNPYKAYFCPAPKGDPSQCKAIFS